jgi:hypothetical protein
VAGAAQSGPETQRRPGPLTGEAGATVLRQAPPPPLALTGR